MLTIKNTQAGPRGINTVGGPVLIEPGQTADVEVSAAELKVAKATGWFVFEGEAKSNEADTEREDLKKRADELGIDYAKNIPTDKLKEMVDAKLAE